MLSRVHFKAYPKQKEEIGSVKEYKNHVRWLQHQPSKFFASALREDEAFFLIKFSSVL